MAKKYILVQLADGLIHVKKKTIFGPASVYDHRSNVVGPFNNISAAETAIQAVETKLQEDRRAKANAISVQGVRYVFDPATDEDLTIRNKFRVVHSGKVETYPFAIQELGLRGWHYVYEEYKDGDKTKTKRKAFATLNSAKTELMAIVQNLQDAADKRKKARVLKVIDARVFELSETNQLESAA